MRSHRVSQGPGMEPVTVADVKLYARVAHSVEDSLVDSWIKAARKLAGDFQNRSFIQTEYQMTYDSFPGRCIEFPRPPLISVVSIKYYDVKNCEYDFGPENYFVDSNSEVGRLALNDGVNWPAIHLRPINGLVIRFLAGYGDTRDTVPDNVKNAIYIYCAHMYENRESENGSVPREFYDLLRSDRMAVY